MKYPPKFWIIKKSFFYVIFGKIAAIYNKMVKNVINTIFSTSLNTLLNNLYPLFLLLLKYHKIWKERNFPDRTIERKAFVRNPYTLVLGYIWRNILEISSVQWRTKLDCLKIKNFDTSEGSNTHIIPLSFETQF